MMKPAREKRSLTNFEWTALLVGVAFIFGLLARFLPGVQAGFPLNDGGMFLSMMRDLKSSGYALPGFTSYNLLQIPYAYPPLGFYLGRGISDIFRASELDILRWLPPLVNSLSVLAVYWLAAELLRSKPLGALASAFYALTPGASSWFIMGGGLTRSLGSLFLLLSVFSVYRLFQNGNGKYLFLSILFCGLAVLSHPEAGVHTAATCILLWLFFGRTWRSFFHALMVGVGVLILSSQWWMTVISYHGLAPFISAMNSGSYGIPVWKAWSGMILGRESYLPILAVLRVAGLAWGIWKKEYFLVAWAIFPYLVEPRSAPSVTFYPLSMLAALAFAEAFPYLVTHVKKNELALDDLYKNTWFNAILFLCLTYLFVASGLYGFRLVNNSLKPADLDAMNWVRETTPADASFLLLTGVPSPEIDPVVEWFPALTERRSLSTVQGYEWLGAGKFMEYYTDLAQLQSCESVQCAEDWAVRTDQEFQYVAIQAGQVSESLLASFAGTANYSRVYATDSVVIYELKE